MRIEKPGVSPASTPAASRPGAPAPQRNGAEVLVEALEREGVDVLFGYPGGASMPIHQALTRSRIRVVLPRHEQGEIFEAEGYARASGKAGVCLATSGPGATNLVTGIADAKMDSVPVVAITGQVPTRVMGTDAFQETPTIEICRAITKHAYLVQRTEDIPRILKDAFHIATTGRPGPVLIDVPKDIQQNLVQPVWPSAPRLRSYNPFLRASGAEIERILQALRTARKPVIYCGGGVVSCGGSEALRRFARGAGIPVSSTVMGLGAFPADDPLWLGMLGMHGTHVANYAVNTADLLLALGVRFDDRVTGKLEEFAKHGTIVHVEVDPSELNKNKRAHIPVASDVGYALERLAALAAPGDYGAWREELAEKRRSDPITFRDAETEIKPQYFLRALSERLGGEAIVATGVGQHQMWAAQWMEFKRPRSFLTSGGLGAMGFGLPAAIGAQVACPDRVVVDVDGDGSFLMNVQELAVARIERLPVKAVILDNQHLGMVVQWEDRFFAGNRGHTYIGDGTGTPYPDFVKMAASFGIPGRQIREKREVPSAIEEMLSTPGPFVLDVLIGHQEHVLPMIPAGKSWKDVIRE